LANPTDSYADYLSSGTPPEGMVLERRSPSPLVHLSRESVDVTIDEPPLTDLRIQMITRGQLTGYGDNGFGRFEGTWHKGDFTVVPPGCASSGEAWGWCEGLVLALNWSLLRPDLEGIARGELPHLGGLHRGVFADETVEQLAGMLWREQSAATPLGRVFTEGVTNALVARLLQLARRPLPDITAKGIGLPPADLRRVTDFIRDHLADDLSLDALASVACVSPFYFCRLFRQSTGESPHRYVLRERLEAARRLIARGNQTLTQIARGVGFYDLAHLTRHVKRAYGVTPGALARQTRRSGGPQLSETPAGPETPT
jgi:AraC family transcriptional regulator